ncbi:MAG: hypothetical protein CL753_02760 [Chloroflexi bacterium]|nr:hypothetical protein [Chloroflexota bacterium]|tara:strand:+ start:883 stop:1308 length:426 start_codon:yes stop_codon:yes gene_type:complete
MESVIGAYGSVPDRYQDEIEEILKGFSDNQESLPTDTLSSSNDSSDSNDYLVNNASDDIRAKTPTPRITKTKIVLLAMAALLIGGFWFWPLIWIGLVLFGIAYLMFFLKPRQTYHLKYWRDKPLEEVPSSRWEKLTEWFRR